MSERVGVPGKTMLFASRIPFDREDGAKQRNESRIGSPLRRLNHTGTCFGHTLPGHDLCIASTCRRTRCGFANHYRPVADECLKL